MTYSQAIAERNAADARLDAISNAQFELWVAGMEAEADKLAADYRTAMDRAVELETLVQSLPMPINYICASRWSW